MDVSKQENNIKVRQILTYGAIHRVVISIVLINYFLDVDLPEMFMDPYVLPLLGDSDPEGILCLPGASEYPIYLQ
jgi:hypothetical protein